jgi:hypothetical protein
VDAAELNERAHALYDACPSVKPAWDQLLDVTRSVWCEYVLAGLTPVDYLPCKKTNDSAPSSGAATASTASTTHSPSALPATTPNVQADLWS